MDKLRRLYALNLGLAVLIILSSYFHALTGYGMSIGSSDMPTSDAVPLGGFFSVWWLIFFGLIVASITIYRRGKKEHKKIAERMACGLVLSCLWAIVAQMTGPHPHWILPILLLGAYIGAVQAYRYAFHIDGKNRHRLYWKITAPLALFAGWLGLAFFVNVSVVAESMGVGVMGLTAGDQAAVLLFAATILTLYITYKTKGELCYPAAVAWGLIGVLLAQFGSLVGDAALASLMILVLGTALLHGSGEA